MTTDPGPVRRLQPFLERGVAFAEPCAGNGDLIESLEWFGHRCVYASDINPGKKTFERRDLFTLDRRWRRQSGARIFITNPPWKRDVLHAAIKHLTTLLPTFLLLDADWMHTRQAVPFLEYCSLIVSVGRVKWIESSDGAGVDNSAWFFFDRSHSGGPRFVGLS